MSIDLSLYLLVDRVASIEDVIPDDKRGGSGFERVPMREGFAPEHTIACWMKRNEPKPPDWNAWLEDGFDFSNKRPESSSCGCVVLLESQDRIFAASFGTGRFAIPDELIEAEFGLRVALNEVNPRQLRSLVTKTIDVKTRQRDTQKLSGADVPEFALDLDVEWLRSAEGKSGRKDCNVVAGSDSLQLRGWRRSLRELSAACGEFLSSFQREIPEVFRFADSVKPIPENDPVHSKLEGDLQAAIQLRYFEQLSLGVEPKIARLAHKCFLSYAGRQFDILDLDDDSLSRGLDDLSDFDPRFDPERVYLKLYDSEGGLLFNKPLANVLQMEIDRDSDAYVRIERRWFRCRGDYIARVNTRVAELADLTQFFDLSPWNKTTHIREEDYIAHVAQEKDWLLQDQCLFYSGDGERVEPCDLLTRERHFIHVKDGKDSSALSHLFGQASGSADLLRRHQAFVQEMKQRYESKWTHSSFERAGKPTVVLAIARPRGMDLFGKMLLSKINVLEHARRIQSHGFDFAVTRIDMDGTG